MKWLSILAAAKRTFQDHQHVILGMAKYSTGSGSGGSGGSCELCGADDADLRTATVAGAQLQVCDDCAEHGEREETGDDREQQRRRTAAQNTARVHDAARNDASHWEDGADYDDDQLPYLVAEYGDRLTEARQDAGFQLEELAEELDVPPADLLALEQGRATQAGVGGSVVGKLEGFLDVELAE
jgi:ribosome-binding protein aMBF1 (putative translation factor)